MSMRRKEPGSIAWVKEYSWKLDEEEDLMIMRTIDQRLGTKSGWVREIIKKFL